MGKRMTFDEMFFQIVDVVAQRSTCLRRHVGGVAVRDNMILATGYNGSVSGAAHCQTCLRKEMKIPSGQRHEICRAIHAEMNIIIQCAKHGVKLAGATVYLSCKPCYICFKMLVQSGVHQIVYREDYPDSMVDNAAFEYCYITEHDDKYYRMTRMNV